MAFESEMSESEYFFIHFIYSMHMIVNDNLLVASPSATSLQPAWCCPTGQNPLEFDNRYPKSPCRDLLVAMLSAT